MDWTRIESPAYWITFVVTFLAVAQWESMRPERAWIVPASRRWTRHGVLLLIASLFRMFVLRVTPLGVALLVSGRDWGLLNLPFFRQGAGYFLAIGATVLLLDISKYIAHRLLHAFGWLWRIHRVHHSDPDFDVSTGARFHPLELVFVGAFDLGMIWLVAPPLAGVVAALVVSCAINFAEHANATLPDAWERRLSGWLITARVHRIHHSTEFSDQNSNFGELAPWWDKLMGTYRGTPAEGAQFQVGIPGYRNEGSLAFREMLLQPLQPSRELTSGGEPIEAPSSHQRST